MFYSLDRYSTNGHKIKCVPIIDQTVAFIVTIVLILAEIYQS